MIRGLLAAAVTLSAVQLVLLALNLRCLPRLSRRSRGTGKGSPRAGRVSVVIPARNEERDVARAVSSHLEQDYPDVEIVVVEDRSSDDTAHVLAAMALAHPRLKVIAGAEPPPGWLGKPHALWQGARVATGDLLLFADADVVYDPRAISDAAALADDRNADLVALLPRVEVAGFWESVLMPYLVFVFFCGLGFVANVRRARSVAAGGGAGNLVRRRAYDAIGGHEALKDSVIDDIHLALKLKRAGFHTLVTRAEDRVRVRMYRGFREVWDGFTKNVAYVAMDASGAVLLALILATLALAILPAGVLIAGLAGAPVPALDLELAGAALGILVAARACMALALGDPVWPSLFHPVLAAVWTGIIGRSFFHRMIRRRLTWRGREYDARDARF